MHTSNFPRQKLRFVLIAGLVLSASAATASQCKGMEQSACLAAGDCTWVDGYTRTDGRAVSSHCKLKGGRKAGQEARADAVKLGKAD